MKQKLFSLIFALALLLPANLFATAFNMTWNQIYGISSFGTDGTRYLDSYTFMNGNNVVRLYIWNRRAQGATYYTTTQSDGVSGNFIMPDKGNYSTSNSLGSSDIFTGYQALVNSTDRTSWVSTGGGASGNYFLKRGISSSAISIAEGADGPYIRITGSNRFTTTGSNSYSHTVTIGSAATYRTVSVTRNDNSMGSVSYVMKSGYVYTNNITNWKNGSTWTLTATPNTGYHFVCWKKGNTQISTNETTDVIIDGNATYTAYFEQDAATKYTITTNVNTAGWGTVTPGGEKSENSNFTITATPASLAYGFVKWQKNGADFSGNTANPITVTVTADATYTAVFEHLPQGVITVVSNYGTVTGAGSYERGTLVTLTVTPNSGYTFAQWSDGNTDNPRYITVTGNATYTAQYYDLNQPLLASFSWDDDDIGVESYGDGDNLCNSFYSPAGKPFKLLYAKSNSRNSKNYLQLSIQSSQSQMWGEVSWAKTGSYPVLSSGLTTGSCGYSTYWYWTLSQTNVCVAYGYDSYDLGLNILGSYLCDKSGNANDASDQSNYISVTEGITCVIEEGAGGNPYIRLVRDADGQCLVSVGEAAVACTYTVTFDANGGSGTMEDQTFNCGEGGDLNPNTFIGPAATVTYNYHNGSSTTSETVNKEFEIWEDDMDGELHDDGESVNFAASDGDIVTMIVYWACCYPSVTLPSPVKSGYTFNGWYTAETGGTRVGGAGDSYTPTAGITLHAQWTASNYTITYNAGANGTGAAIANGSKTPGVNFTLSSSTYSRTGYTQTGWSTSDGGSKAYDLGGTYSTDANLDLYPFWTINTYAITYNKGANGTGTIASGSKTHDVSFTLSSSTFTRTGYTQTGWSLTDGGEKAYNLGGSYTTNSAQEFFPYWSPNTNTAYTVKHYQQNLDGTYPSTPTETDNLTGTTGASVTPAVKSYTGFTAPSTQTEAILADGTLVIEYQYSRNSYTLTWNANGGNLAGGTAAGSTKFGATLTAPTATKTGYTFSSWSPAVPATMPAEAFSTTAQWTANTYTVSFDAGEGSGTMTNQTLTYGVADYLKANTLTGPAATATFDYNGATGNIGVSSMTVNATFTEWSDGNTHTYADQAEVLNLTSTNGGNVTLTAQWDFDYEHSTIYLPSAPTRTGYTFDKWQQIDGMGIIEYDAEEDFDLTEDATLIASWNAINYTITYNGLNGASNSNPASYTIETSTITLANPGTREGYTFTGWTCGGNPITQITIGSTGDKTITANWSTNTHNVSWVTDGNALTGTYTNGTTAYGTTIVAPATPTKNATAQYTYTFNGWSPAVDATMPDNDVEYTATWTQTPVNYTLTWTTDGDALTGDYTHGTVAYGTTIVVPATPTKTGYTFAAWTPTPAATMPAANTTYTATWTANTYTITYNGGANGTGSIAAGVKTYGVDFTLSSSTFTREGYTQTGWSTSDGGAKAYELGGTYTGNAALTLYPYWETMLETIELKDNENTAYYTTFKTNYNGKKVNAKYTRTFGQGRWATLCLPFNVTSGQMMSLKMKGRVYEFNHAEGDANIGDEVILYFSAAKSLEAGKCYIVNANNALAGMSSFTFSSVTINLDADNVADLTVAGAYDNLPGYKQSDNIELIGTLRKGMLTGSLVGHTYMGLKDNKIYYPNTSTGSTVLAYRGVFRIVSSSAVMERMRIVVDGEDAGELEVVNGELQAVPEARKFIRDGVLYIEREGVIYDAAGQRVE